MQKKITLSHSSCSTYKDCPEKYYLSRVDKIKPIQQGASLSFGGAIDNAVQFILESFQTLGKLNFKLSDEVFNSVIDTFLTDNNKGWNRILGNTNIKYSAKDYDGSVITEEDLSLINEWADELKVTQDEAVSAFKQKKYKGITRQQELMYDRLNWLSLRNKGVLMLQAFMRDILPNVEEVVCIQEKIEGEISDNVGVVGYLDFVLRYKGYEKPVVFDLKTSAMMYEDDDAKLSDQLMLYLLAVGEKYQTNLVGYIVLLKQMDSDSVCSKCSSIKNSLHKTCNVNKNGVRCNGSWTTVKKGKTQLLVEEISPTTLESFQEGFSNMAYTIEHGRRYKNLDNCKKYGACDFYAICHFNDFSNFILPVVEEQS
jgi:hypothetical protein